MNEKTIKEEWEHFKTVVYEEKIKDLNDLTLSLTQDAFHAGFMIALLENKQNGEGYAERRINEALKYLEEISTKI